MTDTSQLLHRYTEDGSEAAFRELVTRYLNLVYSVAVRRLGGDTYMAEDVVQTVFTDLARKARSLRPDSSLGGWLHRHTCFVVSNVLRAERRRQTHERDAAEMNTLHDSSDSIWLQIAPLLDEAIDDLSAPDREAVLLRFFENRDFRSVGEALGTNEDAAQKRVSRALEKLRAMLAERGVTLSPTGLTTVLATQAILAAPAHLATQVAQTALTGTSTAATSAFTFSRTMTSTPFKFALGVGIVAMLTVLLFTARREKAGPPRPAADATATTAASPSAPAPLPAEAILLAADLAAADPAAVDTGDVLILTILAADSGKPVPNVVVATRARDGQETIRKEFHGKRDGVCDIVFDRVSTVELDLTTQLDDFADKRLIWSPKNGEVIPTNYTVRLVRAMPIGGQVTDADGQLVAGATVGFSAREDTSSSTRPESHEARRIQTKTDAKGRWRISRIAPELIPRLNGLAQHPEHVSAWTEHWKSVTEMERQLREGTHVFRLGRALSLRGVVVDPEGQPVADAKVFAGAFGSTERRETNSLPDGTFFLAGCKLGTNSLTVEARGFAVTTVQIELAVESQPFRIDLQPAKILRLRVVNESGDPIPKAQVYLNTFARRPPGSTQERTQPVQAEFRPKTDQEGRVVWESAPDAELEFDFEAGGYYRLNGVRVRPDGQEHLVTLQRGVTISGTVRDETSGQPIPQFRILCGWPEPGFDPHTGVAKANAQWSTQDGHLLNFGSGRFNHTFAEPLVSGTANRGFILKFEAEGYVPFVSRTMLPDEAEARFEVLLRAAATVSVRVLLPDGKPAVNADVGLVSPNANLILIPGGFARNNVETGGSLLRTDFSGRFRLPPDPAITRVVAAHPAGYAEATPAALAGDNVLRLQRWGRVEGEFSASRQASDRTMRLEYPSGDHRDFRFDFESFNAKTDAEGRFVFPKAPPIALKIVRLIPTPRPDGMSWAHSHLTEVEVRPGETTSVTLGGHNVTARLRWPNGFARETNWSVQGNIRTPVPKPPTEAMSNSEALRQWYQSPEFAALMAKAKVWTWTESADGSIAIEGVLPGEYEAHVTAIDKQADPGTHSLRAIGLGTVTVPANPPTGTLDLGEIVLQLAPLPTIAPSQP